MNLMRLSVKTAVLYVSLAALFTTMLIASFCLPDSAIKRNVAVSAKQISEEGLWWKPFGVYLYQIDNMTDCIMLSISECDNQKSAVRRALLAEHAIPKSDDVTTSYKDIATTTYDDATGTRHNPIVYADYARYWHGYEVVLRPLLCVFNYWQIRTINYVALTVLAAATLLLLYRRLGARCALTFAATLVASNFMIVPMALQFSSCYYIALAGMCLVLADTRLTRNAENCMLTFFTIGAICSYIDLLTTPVITLGLPLVVVCLMRRQTKLATALGYCCSWMAGYSLLWASKWIIAWAVTGYDVVANAMDAAATRVGDTIVFGGVEMPMSTFIDMIAGKVAAVANPIIVVAALAVMVGAAVWWAYRSRRMLMSERCIVLIALMPLLWFAVLKNHSIQHIFFTWRDWILTLWGMMLIYTQHSRTKNMER